MRLERLMTWSGGIAFIALAAGAGCSKTVPDNVPPTSSASVSNAASIAPPTAALTGAKAEPALTQTSIPARFAAEAGNRPTGVPRVEDVLDAFKKTGADIHDVAQHLGSPFLAVYCVGFQTGTDVHGSICEYKDEATAVKGRDASDKGFGAVQGRKVYRNGGTTLTVRVGDASSANDALVKKMLTAFEAVKPATGPAPTAAAPSPFAHASALPPLRDPPPP